MRALAIAALFVTACSPAAATTGSWCQYPADCARPNACIYSRCRAPCMLDADCPGTHLCLSNRCAVEEDRGCATLVGRTCARGLSCVDDRCSLVCADASRCAPDALCRPSADGSVSICADPSEPPPDAGPAPTDGGTRG